MEAPPWVRCELCEDLFCTLHQEHVADCPCPSLEAWAETYVHDPSCDLDEDCMCSPWIAEFSDGTRSDRASVSCHGPTGETLVDDPLTLK